MLNSQHHQVFNLISESIWVVPDTTVSCRLHSLVFALSASHIIMIAFLIVMVSWKPLVNEGVHGVRDPVVLATTRPELGIVYTIDSIVHVAHFFSNYVDVSNIVL